MYFRGVWLLTSEGEGLRKPACLCWHAAGLRWFGTSGLCYCRHRTPLRGNKQKQLSAESKRSEVVWIFNKLKENVSDSSVKINKANSIPACGFHRCSEQIAQNNVETCIYQVCWINVCCPLRSYISSEFNIY